MTGFGLGVVVMGGVGAGAGGALLQPATAKTTASSVATLARAVLVKFISNCSYAAGDDPGLDRCLCLI
jgi:hypothetical protein